MTLSGNEIFINVHFFLKETNQTQPVISLSVFEL